MKKYLFICCSLFLIANSMAVYAAGAVKLVDYMISSSGLTEILAKNGIKGVDAAQVESYVATSIGSFGAGKTLTQKEFAMVLSKIPVTGEDATIRKELQVLLDKSDADIKKSDVVKAINNIIYLANRYGKSVVITCAECVSDSLTKNGFKFTVENIKNAGSVKLLENVIPVNPKDLHVYITARAKRLGMGNYSSVSAKYVLPSEERTLALFLALAESGSPAYKDFTAMVKKLSTKNGVSNIFDMSNPNKLWKYVSSDVSDVEISKLTAVLKEVDEVKTADKLSIEDAFNRILRKKSESSEDLFQKYKSIKAKRCFFK